MTLGRLAPRPLELLWSVPFGHDAATAPLRPAAQEPRAAFEDVVLEALRRPPCTVSFSGGRDSSAVLAVAAHVARREGLPAPIPVSNRFPAVPASHENDWQERVVAHLGLEDWIRLELGGELDMLGGHATALLRRHGVPPLFNVHFHSPVVAQAAGGTMLTGAGGDELFAGVERARLARLLFARRRPEPGQWRATAGEALPAALRARRGRRTLPFAFPWLRPEGVRELAEAYASWLAAEPLSWPRALTRWWWPSRRLQCTIAALDLLGRDAGVLVRHPFSDARTLAAYAGGTPRGGVPGRVAGLSGLVGDLLPDGCLRRTSKASFNAAIWGPRARAFGASWPGTGIEDDRVDLDALAAEWRKDDPDPHSFALLQTAWLAAGGAQRVEQDVEPGLQR
ncbi:hypothetical protein FSW04_03115 [Baekduia soli]|uniref:Asparagine synthetase domain-containing protein n=1 Tax=Baekduia soli TaxID=496014 RepID=A0A5B8U103_9ACTN|nr:asparagine synthase-related protein [Baekduia soli]QEC46671.1 hypothetical protein FSW04_03115 [Baekduia soli]